MSLLREMIENIQNVCVCIDTYMEKLDETDHDVENFKTSLKWFRDGESVHGFVKKGHICMYDIMRNNRGGSHEKDPFYLIQQIKSDDQNMAITVRTLSSYMDSFWSLCTIQLADRIYAHKTDISSHNTTQVSPHLNGLLAKLKNESS